MLSSTKQFTDLNEALFHLSYVYYYSELYCSYNSFLFECCSDCQIIVIVASSSVMYMRPGFLD